MQNKHLKFDLFRLHDNKEDKDPRWSWIRASGKDLSPYVYSLIKELTNKYGTNNAAKKIKELISRLSIETILDYIWSKRDNFPLVFLEALCSQFKEKERIKQNIQDKIDYLSISRQDSKPIKAVKKLDLDLCKLSGAHAADGSLWSQYNYELIDSDKLAVIKFTQWLESVFGYKIEAKLHKKSKAYNVYFKSRIIGRYLNKFLGFPIGKKTDIVEEPLIIKNSNLDFRKAFVLGVMSFDGSVDCRGKVALHSRSKKLVNSIYSILKTEKIELAPLQYYKPRKQYYFQSRYMDKKLLTYFEKDTGKWIRLNELVYGFQGKAKTLDEAKKAFDIAYSKTKISLITFSELLDFMPKNQSFSYINLIKILKSRNIKISDTTLKYYIKILIKNRIVLILRKKGQFKRFIMNNNIIEWKVPKR